MTTRSPTLPDTMRAGDFVVERPLVLGHEMGGRVVGSHYAGRGLDN